MKLDPINGLLAEARYAPSPNCDIRPPQAVVAALIVHAISLPPGHFGGDAIEQFFQNRLPAGGHPYFAAIARLKVSAHFLIRRDGELIQFVPTTHRAWHAGQSSCLGRPRVNDFSIGVELEGCDDRHFDAPQYAVLADLTRALMAAYPAITRERLFGHSDIAPGRKTDPGPCFDWQCYRALIG